MIPSSSLISTAARTSVAGMCACIVLLCRYRCAALQPCAHPSCSLAHRSVTRALTKRGVILKKIAAKERKVQQRLRKEQGVCEHGVGLAWTRGHRRHVLCVSFCAERLEKLGKSGQPQRTELERKTLLTLLAKLDTVDDEITLLEQTEVDAVIACVAA